MMLASVDLANLVYLAGALLAATLGSAVYVLRHRKPRSMEAAINAFSRELRALAPDARSERAATSSTSVSPGGARSSVGPPRRPANERARRSAPEAGDGETG
jgi:hypothetical protein